jgi:CheY-like chemotaxis protein
VEPNSSLPTALIIEDESLWGEILSRYLKAKGCEVTWMKDSADALRFIEDSRPDLILTDLKLAGNDGALFVEKLDEMGDEITSKTAVVTSFPVVARTWATHIPIFPKSDLSRLGQWVGEVLAARHDR